LRAKREILKRDYSHTQKTNYSCTLGIKVANLQILFKIVNEIGGIEKYLESCKINKIQIEKLKQKLCK
jgi:hypothetical protein